MRQRFAASLLQFAPCGVAISTPTQANLSAIVSHRTDSAEFSCREFVMANAFPPTNPANHANRLPASRLEDDDGFDSDLDHEVILLLQENARLRALVAQLSSLVLKHVVDGK